MCVPDALHQDVKANKKHFIDHVHLQKPRKIIFYGFKILIDVLF